MEATSTVAPALEVATLVALTAEPALAVEVEGVTNVTVVPPVVVTVVVALDAVGLDVVEYVDPVTTVPAVVLLSLATVDPVDAVVPVVLLSFVVVPVVVAAVDLLSPVEPEPDVEVFEAVVEPVEVFDVSLLVVVAAVFVSVEEASFFPSVVWPLAVSLVVVPEVFTSAAGAALITTGVSLACFKLWSSAG